MDFSNLNDLEHNGFTGFKSVEQLWMDKSPIPKAKGVYLVQVRVAFLCRIGDVPKHYTAIQDWRARCFVDGEKSVDDIPREPGAYSWL